MRIAFPGPLASFGTSAGAFWRFHDASGSTVPVNATQPAQWVIQVNTFGVPDLAPVEVEYLGGDASLVDQLGVIVQPFRVPWLPSQPPYTAAIPR